MSLTRTITIEKVAVVLHRTGMDQVVIKTTLPSPVPMYPEGADFVTWAQRDFGVDYARANFPGVDLEVINARST